MKRRVLLVNARTNINELLELRSTEDMIKLIESLSDSDGVGALVFPSIDFKKNYASIVDAVIDGSVSGPRIQCHACVRDMLGDLLLADSQV